MNDDSLNRSLRIFDAKDASRYASELFRESFNAALPTPTSESWHQYVARYTWPDGAEETVGFCNWIKRGDVYLQGGMCVRASFYRRLPRERYREIQRRRGLAQMMMALAETELNDCQAWFGYCGDRKALAVDLRAGYRTTEHKFVIVKWFKALPPEEEKALVDSIAAIGPF